MNEVTIYNEIRDPMQAVSQLGSSIAKSQMFGCQSVEQGQVLALECLAQKLPPLSLARRFDLMKGKLSMKSQAMLSDFNTRGGKHKMTEKSPDRAAMEMNDRDGNKYTFELTWEQAKQETFPYLGKEADIVEQLAGDRSGLKLKPKYATPRSRANMLWNRLISDAVRTLDPEINCGVYTPEETEDFGNEVEAIESQAVAAVLETAKVEVEKPWPGVVDDETEVIEGEVIDDQPEPEPTPEPEQQPHNAEDPITEDTINFIKSSIVQAAQVGMADLGKKVKAKLVESGLDKLSDLTQAEGQLLLDAIKLKNFGKWLEVAVTGHAAIGAESGNGQAAGEKS